MTELMFKRYEGRRCFLGLKNNRVYTGIINEVVDLGNGLIFIGLTDKFGNFITISSGEIEFIEEQPEREEEK